MNTLRPFIFGLHDYRDIKIADGVRQICSERDHDRLLVVHGDGHSFGIDFYLKNLNLGRAKLLFYHKYEEYAKSRGVSVVREYSPVSNSDAALALERDAESCPDIYLLYTPENYAWKKGELPQKS